LYDGCWNLCLSSIIFQILMSMYFLTSSLFTYR
jgi:hypothetical protein